MTKCNLSDAEFEIMEFVWTCEKELIFDDIMEYVKSRGHTWKIQTVQTFLTRLISKGALKADKRGIRKYYLPAMTKEEYISKWTKDLVKTEFGGTLKHFLSAFTGGKSLTEEEASELQEFLDE